MSTSVNASAVSTALHLKRQVKVTRIMTLHWQFQELQNNSATWKHELKQFLSSHNFLSQEGIILKESLFVPLGSEF